jgi:hypothetical protein
LNKRSEIFNTCRHRKKMLLELAKTWVQADGSFFPPLSFFF